MFALTSVLDFTMSQESTIKELTEEMINKVLEEDDTETKGEEKQKRDVVEIQYKKASEGDRERPWVVSNKMITMAELPNDEKVPLISIFEKNPEKIPFERWTKLFIQNRKYMIDRKSFLFVTNCACEVMHDKTKTVVTHLMIHSEHEKNTEVNKEFWKRQFAKYMKVGAMTWEEVDEQWSIKDQDLSLENLKVSD